MKKPSKTYSKSRKMDFGGTLHDIGLGVADELIPTGLLTGQSASKQFGWDYDTVDGQNYQKGFQNVSKIQKGLAPVVAGAAGTAIGGPMVGAAASSGVGLAQNIYASNQVNKAAQPVFPQIPMVDNRQGLSKMAYGGIVGGRNMVQQQPAYHISNSNQMGGNFNIGGFLPHTAQIGTTISNVNQVTGQGAYNGVVPDEDVLAKGGSIHIKPENKGKFTAYKERTGKTTEEALHSPNAHVRQMANFALQSSKWNKKDMGGYIEGSTHDLGEQEIKDLIKQGYKIEYV